MIGPWSTTLNQPMHRFDMIPGIVGDGWLLLATAGRNRLVCISQDRSVTIPGDDRSVTIPGAVRRVTIPGPGDRRVVIPGPRRRIVVIPPEETCCE